jgi:hypothetical protein
MRQFNKLQPNENIQLLIKTTFDANLPIAGGWGYELEDASSIKALPNGMTLPQLQHMLTSIRAHLEMNITQEKENRYSGINANEKEREELKIENALFNKVTYEVTAMHEELYNKFIKEYKEGYGKETFDINDHFKRRKEATISRNITHYFEVTSLQ